MQSKTSREMIMSRLEKHIFSRFNMLNLLLLILVSANACTQHQPAQPLDEVTVQLKWVHQAQFAGMYIAQEKGFYLDEGLRVTFLEGGSGIDTIDPIITGRADFSLTTPFEVITAIDQGADLKVIATIMQLNPSVFVAMADSGITHPQDFIGKNIAVLNHKDYTIQLTELMRLLGLDIQQVNLVPHTYDYTNLVNGTVDVVGFSAIGGLIRLRNEGYQLNLIWPSEYDINLNSDCLITTSSIAKSAPDFTSRFVNSTLKGWQYALAHPEEAVDATMRYAFEQDREIQQQLLTATIPFLQTGDSKLGWSDKAVWLNTQNILLRQGTIQKWSSIDDILDQTFTRDFYGLEK